MGGGCGSHTGLAVPATNRPGSGGGLQKHTVQDGHNRWVKYPSRQACFGLYQLLAKNLALLFMRDWKGTSGKDSVKTTYMPDFAK